MWRGKQKREGREEVGGGGGCRESELALQTKEGDAGLLPFLPPPNIGFICSDFDLCHRPLHPSSSTTCGPSTALPPSNPPPPPTPHTHTPYPHSTTPSTFYPTTTTPGNILTVEVCRGLDSLFDRQHSPPVQLPKGART